MKSRRREVAALLAQRAQADVKAKLSRLIPGARAIGVTVPEIRSLATKYHAEHLSLSVEDRAQLLDELCIGRVREEILFGIFLLAKRGKEVAELPWERVERWLPALDNWETCDQLASNLAGAIVARKPVLVDELVAMTSSSNLWHRRFAVATAAKLNQQGRDLARETLRVCSPLLADDERLVQKAVGWAIREASRRHEALVHEFLMKARSRAHPRVIVEASEKLTHAHRRELAASETTSR